MVGDEAFIHCVTFTFAIVRKSSIWRGKVSQTSNSVGTHRERKRKKNGKHTGNSVHAKASLIIEPMAGKMDDRRHKFFFKNQPEKQCKTERSKNERAIQTERKNSPEKMRSKCRRKRDSSLVFGTFFSLLERRKPTKKTVHFFITKTKTVFIQRSGEKREEKKTKKRQF